MSAHAPTVVSAQARAWRHRKNVESLSPSQLDTFRRAFGAVEAIGDDRGFGHWAGLHGLPLPMYCQHGTRIFLPWHRAYLYFFELALRDQVSAAALVWWDWTSVTSHTKGIPAAYSQRRVGGTTNPLFSAAVPPPARVNGQPRQTTRASDTPASLPSVAQVQAILQLPDFLVFQSQLENIHNQIHVWIGGVIGRIAPAAPVPIFFVPPPPLERRSPLPQTPQPGPTVPPRRLCP